MKILLSLLSVFLTVSLTLSAQQKFSSLPIGANLDGYINGIEILVAGGGLDPSAWQPYPYSWKRDGKLEAFAVQKLREYTASINLANGSAYGWEIHAITDGIGGLLPAYNGKTSPATIASAPPTDVSPEFRLIPRNNRWEVPEEVFGKVRFEFPWGIPFYIPDAKHLKVNLYGPNGRVARFSTKEKISDADNPCELPAIIDLLRMGIVTIPTAIVIAEKGVWWNRAEVIVLTEAEETTFESYYPPSPDDGKAIRWSNPPPLFFTPPPPKIASLKRVGDVTEILVEGNGSATLEFSENLREWRAADTTHIALTSESGRVFRHKTVAASGYYRLRLKDGAQ